MNERYMKRNVMLEKGSQICYFLVRESFLLLRNGFEQNQCCYHQSLSLSVVSFLSFTDFLGILCPIVCSVR